MAKLTQVPKRWIWIQQNLRRRSPLLVWTLRLRSIWLYRNIFILIFLYKQIALNHISHLNLLHANRLTEYLTQVVLIKKLNYLLTHIHLKSYTVVTSKFSRSCDYWILLNGLNYLTDKDLVWRNAINFKKRWYAIYVNPYALIGVFLANKFYKPQLIRLLQLLIYSWQTLNSQRIYHSGYLIFTNNWLVVRFLFLRYFKILNF